MKSYAQALEKLETFYAPAYSKGHGPSKSLFKRLFNEVRDALPSLQIYVVARVRGPIIDKHVRGMLGGTKFEYKHQYKGDPTPGRVADCIVSAFARAHELSKGGGVDTNFIGDAIVPEVIPILEQALLHVKNQDKASVRVEENKKKQQEANRQEAMNNLAETIASFPYSRDEVLAAWELDQVKKVMES